MLIRGRFVDELVLLSFSFPPNNLLNGRFATAANAATADVMLAMIRWIYLMKGEAAAAVDRPR